MLHRRHATTTLLALTEPRQPLPPPVPTATPLRHMPSLAHHHRAPLSWRAHATQLSPARYLSRGGGSGIIWRWAHFPPHRTLRRLTPHLLLLMVMLILMVRAVGAVMGVVIVATFKLQVLMMAPLRLLLRLGHRPGGPQIHACRHRLLPLCCVLVVVDLSFHAALP